MTFAQLIVTPGFLTDRQILAALEQGYLIERGTWDPSMLRHASYTLRLGNRVELCRAAEATQQQTKQFAIVQLDQTKPLELNPGDCALLYSMENVRLPAEVLAFTVARGLLFAESLVPENTYVDPGFPGPLYTTVTNVSNRVIRLTCGMPIARLFLYRLSEAVGEPYRSGSANGIKQQLESVRAATFGTPEECSNAKDSELLSQVRLVPLGGIHLHELFQRESRKRGQLLLLTVSWPILLTIANTSMWLKDSLGPFFGSVLASLVAGLIVIFGPRLYRYWAGE